MTTVARNLRALLEDKQPSLPGTHTSGGHESSGSTAGCVIINMGDWSKCWVRKSIPNPSYPEGWSFAKGGVDKGETKQEGALREAEEELGITARIIDDIGSFSSSTSKVHFFLATRSTGPDASKWRANKETAQVALVTWAEAVKLFKTFGNTRDVKVVLALVPRIAKELGIAEDAVLGASGRQLSSYEKDLIGGIKSIGDTTLAFARHVLKFKTEKPDLQDKIATMLDDLAQFRKSSVAVAARVAED